jgi:site-specific recombinase XerD
MAKIDTVDARTRLKPKAEPYWVKLSTGCTLGFRKMTPGSIGTWVARYRNADTGERDKRSLGEFGELPPSQRYGSAKAAAETWFTHLSRGGTTAPTSVKQACAIYVSHVRSTRGEAPAEDMRKRFERWIDSDDTLGKIDLSKLTRARVEKWRSAMAGTPVKVNRDNRATPITRARSAGSVNRDISALRAALNHAHDMGHTTSDMAWRVALRPAKNADRRRDVYLDIRQRRALIDKAAVDVAKLLHGLALVPLRPGALAALTIGSLDPRLGVLLVGKDKAGRDRKIKLPHATAQFFSTQAKGKTPNAPLLSRADGKAWDKDAWKWPIKDAARAANLPADTTCYAMRHSVITDLVTGGLDLLTVALLSGTSVAMIERHYGHLRADHAAAALATLAL